MGGWGERGEWWDGGKWGNGEQRGVEGGGGESKRGLEVGGVEGKGGGAGRVCGAGTGRGAGGRPRLPQRDAGRGGGRAGMTLAAHTPRILRGVATTHRPGARLSPTHPPPGGACQLLQPRHRRRQGVRQHPPQGPQHVRRGAGPRRVRARARARLRQVRDRARTAPRLRHAMRCCPPPPGDACAARPHAGRRGRRSCCLTTRSGVS